MMTIKRLGRAFMPSNTLARYLVKMLLTRFFGFLVGLTAILQLLDLMATSDDIMKADGATWMSLLSYVSMRAPQLISQFTPFAALLATLLTLATLNQNSEIVIMKASGLSSHKILLPLGMAALLISMGHFIFNERVVVRGTAELDYWQSNDYAIDLPPNTSLSGRVWVKEGSNIILANAVSKLGEKFVLDKVFIFERDKTKKIQAMVSADFAWYQAGVWTLHEVRRFDATTHALTITSVEDWPIKTKPERFLALTVKPSHVSFITLWQSMQRLKSEGLPIDRPMSSFLHKFAAPAATLLMPLLAAVAAFGVHRAGSLAIRIVFGMALGFSFFVADNFMRAMGEFGVAPPLLASWAPFLLFLLVGYSVIFNTEEGSRPRRGH